MTKRKTSPEREPLLKGRDTPPLSNAPTLSWTKTINLVSLFGLFFLAFIVRLFRLSIPTQVVFDEVHFGKFASKYIRGEFFFDVHPPLGKLLFAFAGWISGYDGNFSFKKIGLDYEHESVPYVTMRLFAALSGVCLVPLAYLTISLMVLFENAFVTQSRFILLDSFLLLFTGLVAYSWTEFQWHRKRPFTVRWWLSLILTGVFLGLVTSVKWVGLFSVALIGFCTLVDLWDLACDASVSMKSLVKHFFARAFSLIVVPLSIYIFWFYIHFELFTHAGTAVGIVSPAFQSSLKGVSLPDTFKEVAYGSKVYIRHDATRGGYLHSHKYFYPSGSKQQQITCYGYRDDNNLFLIKKPLVSNGDSLAEDPIEGFVRIRHGDVIRLEHISTTRRLHSHDIRPSVTEKKTHNEASCYGDPEDPNFIGDTNDHWRVEIFGYKSDGPDQFLNAVESKFRLVHVNTGCHLFSHDTKLPEWGFKQQEVTCAKDGRKELTAWTIEFNEHEQMPSDAHRVNYKKLNFVQKLIEIHQTMWKSNSNLKSAHPWASRPGSWPTLKRGIKFWTSKIDAKEIYLIGNPFIWWGSLMSIFVYFAYQGIAAVLAQRWININKRPAFGRYSESGAFVVLGWALHYLPFYLMDRQLFLHHYLPSLYFSILSFGVLFEVITIRVRPIPKWVLVLILSGLFIWTFVLFSPLSFGSGFKDEKQCQSVKWNSDWDFKCQYSNDVASKTGLSPGEDAEDMEEES